MSNFGFILTPLQITSYLNLFYIQNSKHLYTSQKLIFRFKLTKLYFLSVFLFQSIKEGNSFILSLTEGGTIMTAYQYTRISYVHRDQVSKGVQHYCMLDIFELIMIYNYWKRVVE